jgi:hypothetical protein
VCRGRSIEDANVRVRCSDWLYDRPHLVARPGPAFFSPLKFKRFMLNELSQRPLAFGPRSEQKVGGAILKRTIALRVGGRATRAEGRGFLMRTERIAGRITDLS